MRGRTAGRTAWSAGPTCRTSTCCGPTPSGTVGASPSSWAASTGWSADDAPDPPPAEPAGSPEQRAGDAHGHVQALAARLERLETGESADLEDALRAELAAQVAGQLAAAAQEYAVAAHELAAHLHRAEADQLDSVGEFERAELQRKAAAIDDDLASGRRSHPAG